MGKGTIVGIRIWGSGQRALRFRFECEDGANSGSGEVEQESERE
jgi:hypothetical protein